MAVPAASAASLSINAFYARLDAEGRVVWIKAVSGAGLQTTGALAVAGNGDLLVLGACTAAADTDGDGAGDLEFKSMGRRKARNQLDGNSFLLRVSPDGERIWARRYMAGAGHVASSALRIAISGTYCGDLDLNDDGVLERRAAAAFTADGQYLYFSGYTRPGADYDGDGKIESASVCHQLGDIYLAVFKRAD